MVKKVAIVGAGPSGVLLAHYLLRRSDEYQIEIYERRSDPRTISFSKSRTFPISLSERGMNALRQISGLEEAVKAISLEMTGAIFHQKNGKARLTPRKQPLFTLNRTSLVIVLLEKLNEKYNNSRLNIHFNCQCIQVDFAEKKANFQKNETNFAVDYDFLIGADGSRSVIRENFLDTELFECEQKYIPSDYKSIFIPRPDATVETNLKPDKIHTWALDDGTIFLLLHQRDETISGVIYFPHQNNQLVGLSNKEEVLKFFCKHFPEVGQLMPESEAAAFLARPISRIITVRCNRYHQGSSVLLIGDAAHAVSSSIGQGCNAALEDVVLLNNLLDEYSDNLPTVLEQFTIRRQVDAHALVELGDYAFPASKRLLIEFIFRELISKTLHRLFPQRFAPSLFELISESTVPYSEILNLYQSWISKVKKF
ncbi:FAD-dependent monooxygenase [Nostocaceae cyanobacterium CENA357]|uniref:FAD-dependent monooxygenase n=1 Tax=Atlanticothrix silvestris CENA357 TaxID=1725252 RepID=A0A8J7HHS9_9CYAN|nr:NAD(P)/FAD-dependent oxidoreductase [Atlanticothrix silvestris]MBH8552816.1 FAD-dependent monooxygenase [Atlanticothrix silvestris CENA357]